MIETKHWLVEFRNEWRQLRGRYNWYSMTLIYIYFEREKIAHGYEFWFMLFGLGFIIRYNTDKSLAQFEEWGKEISNAEAQSIRIYTDSSLTTEVAREVVSKDK